MEFAVIWSYRARAALHKIFDYIAEDNRSAAERLSGQILDQTELLRQTPRIGQRYATDDDREVRQLVQGNYRIFYEIREEQSTVIILTVWHAARRDPQI